MVEYWACKRCLTGFEIDFYGQQCIEDFVPDVMAGIYADQVEKQKEKEMC